MIVTDSPLPGVKIIEPKILGDERGFFVETWHSERYRAAGLPGAMVQDNLSRSVRGVLRGLHYQWPQPQGKLVYVLEGEVLDVAVDVRIGSPTFGQSFARKLDADTKTQLYLPEGFAHGFYVTSDSAVFAYKCTAPYAPQFDRGILWSDPDLGIDWQTSSPSLSRKDAVHQRLRDVPHDLLPQYVAS